MEESLAAVRNVLINGAIGAIRRESKVSNISCGDMANPRKMFEILYLSAPMGREFRTFVCLVKLESSSQ